MSRVATGVVVALLVSSVGGRGQAPGIRADHEFVLIEVDTRSTSRLERELNAAGKEGFGVQAFSSLRVVLKRDSAGPRTYKVVATTRDTTLIKELNEAGSQGFRLVRTGAFITGSTAAFTAGDEWIVLLQREADARFSYSGVTGDDSADRALNSARQAGANIVAILGKAPGQLSLPGRNPKPLLILEQLQGVTAPSEGSERAYRVISTTRSSTLEKEINQAASEGFRVIGSGFMTVVMDRVNLSPARGQYRVIATTRASTAERELQQAAMAGLRIAAAPQSPNEWLFVLQEIAGGSQLFQYRFVELRQDSTDDELRRAEADGYRAVGGVDRIAVLEKSSAH